MNIIIAGMGKVGSSLAEVLSSEDHDITVIDSDKSVVKTASEKYDVMTVSGNSATLEVLKNAGVKNADLLITSTGSDEINMISCITAKKLNERIQTISRIRNPEYYDQIYSMKDRYGITMIVNPELDASDEIEKLIRGPGFLKRDSFAKGKVQLAELKIESNSKLAGVTLNKLSSVTKANILICLVKRKDQVFVPDGGFTLMAGDRIYIAGSVKDLENLLRDLNIIPKKARKVIICGGGKISYYLAYKLSSDSSINVKIIEKDEDRCVSLASSLPNVNIVCGDASNISFLESEWVSDADALVNLTGLDELNIILSIYGQSVGVPNVITKLGRGTANMKFISDTANIGSVISPKELCCDRIVSRVTAMKNQTGAANAIHFIADGKAQAMEFDVNLNFKHLSKPLKDVKLKKGILLGCIMRKDHTIIPNGDTTVEYKDTLVVVSSSDRIIEDLNDIFED